MRRVYLLTLPESFASGVLGARDLLRFDARLLNVVDGHGDDPGAVFYPEIVGPRRFMETTFGPPLEVDRKLPDTGPADVVYVSPLLLAPGSLPSMTRRLSSG